MKDIYALWLVHGLGLTQFVWNGFTQRNCIELWSHSPHTDAGCLIENMKRLGAHTRTHGHLDHKNYQLSLISLSPVRRKYYEANISLATCPFTAQWLLIKGELKPNLTQWNPIKCVISFQCTHFVYFHFRIDQRIFEKSLCILFFLVL